MKTALQLLLSERVIAFNPLLADIAGDVKGGLFLSQCCFMSREISKDADGWFYATDSQWYDATRLTRREITRIRGILAGLGVLRHKVKGQSHKTYYRVDWARLEALLLATQNSPNNAQNDERDICKNDAVKNCTDVQNVRLQVNEKYVCKRTKRTVANEQNVQTKRNIKRELKENLKNTLSVEKEALELSTGQRRVITEQQQDLLSYDLSNDPAEKTLLESRLATHERQSARAGFDAVVKELVGNKRVNAPKHATSDDKDKST